MRCNMTSWSESYSKLERIYKKQIFCCVAFASSKNIKASFFADHKLPWTDLKRLHSQKFKVDITGWEGLPPDERKTLMVGAEEEEEEEDWEVLDHLKAGLADAPRTPLWCRGAGSLVAAVRTSSIFLPGLHLLRLLIHLLHGHADADIRVAGG